MGKICQAPVRTTVRVFGEPESHRGKKLAATVRPFGIPGNSPAVKAVRKQHIQLGTSTKRALIPMSTHQGPQNVSTSHRQVPKSTPQDPQKVSASCPYPLRRLHLSDCQTYEFRLTNFSSLQVLYLKPSRRRQRRSILLL